MKTLWFKNKTYGYGWVPVTWQGYAVVALHLIITIGAAYLIWKNLRSIPSPTPQDLVWSAVGKFIAIELVATIALMIVAYKTGEKPEWRWGDKKE